MVLYANPVNIRTMNKNMNKGMAIALLSREYGIHIGIRNPIE